MHGHSERVLKPCFDLLSSDFVEPGKPVADSEENARLRLSTAVLARGAGRTGGGGEARSSTRPLSSK